MGDRSALIHHECVQKAYRAAVEWWKEETSSGRRCRSCWLREYECFCPQTTIIKENLRNFQEQVAVRMCIYYHFQEIGRSANTAHVFEAIYSSPLPDTIKSSCEVILFGDINAESKLIDEMNEEQESNCLQTCVLYPTNTAVSLNEWLANRSDEAKSKPVRIVTLDGTYPQADRQWRHLARALELVHGKQLPLVKLDLVSGTVPSALLGIQSQPGVDKLCSYQAMVLALQQANQTKELCDYLSTCLDRWLQHILSKRIKYGKVNQNFKLPPGTEPAPYVKMYQKKNAPTKWTASNGPPPDDFYPVTDTRYLRHLPRINNPYRSQDFPVSSQVFWVPFINQSPALVVFDVSLHHRIQLYTTKQFSVFSIQD